MSTRYEWVMGPTLISAAERTEFHHGKGKLEAVGPRLWLYVGQVRDLELGGIVNWTMRAEGNSANAHLRLGEFIAMFPRATDWMRSAPRAGPSLWWGLHSSRVWSSEGLRIKRLAKNPGSVLLCSRAGERTIASPLGVSVDVEVARQLFALCSSIQRPGATPSQPPEGEHGWIPWQRRAGKPPTNEASGAGWLCVAPGQICGVVPTERDM